MFFVKKATLLLKKVVTHKREIIIKLNGAVMVRSCHILPRLGPGINALNDYKPRTSKACGFDVLIKSYFF